MTNFQQLDEKLDKILLETTPLRATQQLKKPADPFIDLKTDIAAKFRQIREQIKKRDESGDLANVENVATSAAVRREIKEAEEELKKLEMAQMQMQKKGADPTKIELYDDVIKSLHDELIYCQELEKRRLGVVVPVTPDETLPPAEIPDGPQFATLVQQDKKLDETLDSIATKVETLHKIAIDIRDTAGTQEKKLEDLDVTVNDANKSLVTVNQRLRNILTKAAPGDKFLIYFILLCVLLGIGGTIYGVFFKN